MVSFVYFLIYCAKQVKETESKIVYQTEFDRVKRIIKKSELGRYFADIDYTRERKINDLAGEIVAGRAENVSSKP